MLRRFFFCGGVQVGWGCVAADWVLIGSDGFWWGLTDKDSESEHSQSPQEPTRAHKSPQEPTDPMPPKCLLVPATPPTNFTKNTIGVVILVEYSYLRTIILYNQFEVQRKTKNYYI